MTKPTAIIIAIIAISFATVLVSSAYGEEQIYYEPKFRFPIPESSNIDKMAEKCGLQSISDTAMIIRCEFVIMFAEDGKKWYEELVDRIGLGNGTSKGNGTSTDKPKSNFVPQKLPDYFDDYEDDKKFFEKNEPRDYQEIVYSEKLDLLELCQRGLGEATGVQQVDSYITANYTVTEATPKQHTVETNTPEGDLDLAIEECYAQRYILQPDTLGIYTENRGKFFGINQPNHQDLAIVDEDKWLNIFTHETYPSSKQYETAHDIICNNPDVTLQFKKLQDPPCTDEQLGIDGKDRTKQNDTGVGGTGGFVFQYNTEDRVPLDRLDQYRIDKGEEQRVMLEQAVRDEVAANQIKARQTVTSSEVQTNDGWDMCPNDGGSSKWDNESRQFIYTEPKCIDVKIVCDLVNGMKENCRKVYGD